MFFLFFFVLVVFFGGPKSQKITRSCYFSSKSLQGMEIKKIIFKEERITNFNSQQMEMLFRELLA